MNDNEAKKLLDETFNTKFDSKRFSNFLKELFNGFYPQNKSISPHSEYIEKIASIEKIGNYKQNNKSMEILIVQLKKGTSLDKARTMQRNVVAKLLKNFNIDSALVAFISEDSPDWRFSFIKMDYNLMEDGKVSEELTPAKRYSFLVGPNEPNHTCRSQFVDLIKTEIKKPSIDEIENAFSIEKVTKEFFEKYKNLYHHLKNGLDDLVKKDKNLKEEFSDKQISTVDFAKKLLGQIVFLYFLQKKGWLGIKKGEKGKFEQWGKGSKRFIQELFYKAQQERKNFFNDYLEPLFYHALATDRRADGDYYEKFNCKVPFLNGGLFEPLNGYNWGETDINLNNDLFEEIFSTFDEFNFTIKEDEPLEKEVAVDPEMLGKVFENLLDVEDRKSKGAFYTPREIVHYMCQQSLINYLETNIDILRKDLEFFVQKGDLALEYLKRQEIGKGVKEEFVLPDSIKKNAKELDRLLTEIKICDPAVGSGAFPVGMMNEIIKARTILSYLLKKLKTDYELKRDTIENSLYGVDIEPSAVEITKLRFWLSLIVDEEDMDNIRPLPNLENKIMCGNSLIEEFEGVKLYKDPKEIKQATEKQVTLDQGINKKIKKSEQKLKELRKKQKEFFDEENRTKKNKLREEIDKIEWKFIEETLKEQGNEEAMKKLEQYKKNKSKPFFLWKLYFSDVFNRDNPGFDVVIANPPYVRVQSLSSEEKIMIKRNFRSATKNFDIYVVFDEKGMELLRKDGTLSYIQPNKFFNSDYGVGIRELISDNRYLNHIIDFRANQIFNTATTYTCILICKKFENKSFVYTSFKGSHPTEIFLKYIAGNKVIDNGLIEEKIDLTEVNKENWSFGEAKYKKIFNKLELNKPLSEYASKIFQGIVTGADPIFLLEEKEGKLFSKSLERYIKIEKNILLPLLKGSEIRRYCLKANKYWLIFPYTIDQNKAILYNEKRLEKDFPKTFEYLCECKEKLLLRDRGKIDKKKWYGYSRIQNMVECSKKKIMTQVLAKKAMFTLDSFGKYYFVGGGNAGGYGLILKNDSLNYKFILGILNSSLSDFYLKNHTSLFQGGYYSYAKRFIEKIPIKVISREKQKPLIEIVDKILSITKDDDYSKNPEKQAKVKAYERRINRLVYNLYGLTDDEIKIIEAS